MATIHHRVLDLVPEILCYLSVKSLIRFQCVHKSWYVLIRTEYFVFKHLSTFNDKIRTSNITRFTHIIVKNFRCKWSNDRLISLLYLDQQTDSFFLHYLRLFRVYTGTANIEICGPCNGLYFIHDDQHLNIDYSMLINPSMREQRFIPKIDFPHPQPYVSVYPGFGFDHKTNDYKVFVILTTKIGAREYARHVMIYSLNSNSWREILTPVPSFSYAGRRTNALAHGVFHRCACNIRENILLAFDLAEEVFKKISLPKIDDFSWDVIPFKDSIGAVASHIFSIEYGKSFELWVMEEYGNEGSWIQYFSIDTTQGIDRILGLWKHDEFLMIDRQNNMVLYLLKSQSIIKLKVGINVGVGCKQAAFYMESLISLRRENEQDQAQAYFLEICPQRSKRQVQEQKKRKEPYQPDNSRLKRVCK